MLLVEMAFHPGSQVQLGPNVIPSKVAGIAPSRADGAGLSNVTTFVCARAAVAASAKSAAIHKYLFNLHSIDASNPSFHMVSREGFQASRASRQGQGSLLVPIKT